MALDQFTPQAAILWSTISPETKKRILKHAFCAKCMKAVEIVDYKGTEQNGDIKLEGRCKQCGTRVERIVEPSEAPGARN